MVRNQLDNTKMPSDTLLAYLAGIIDGEGCISIAHINPYTQKGNFILKITCSMAYPAPAVVLLQQTFGGAIFDKTIKASVNVLNPKRLIVCEIASINAKNALTLMLPYLKVKKAEAELGLEFLASRILSNGKKLSNVELSKREDFFNRMKALK